MRHQPSWHALAAALAALLAAAGGAAAGEKIEQRPERADLKHARDEKAIRATAAAYVKAFNAGDAKAVSAFWTPDGDYVDADGNEYRGRDAIAKEFARFFAENPGVKLELESRRCRFPAAGVAIVDGVARLQTPSGGVASSSHYTVTHVKKDGEWLMASVRELAQESASNYDHLRELEWLIGTWTAKSGKLTVQQTCEWVADRNFLSRKYVVKDGAAVVRKGLQIIGWDPTAGRIRAWSFSGDGGFGEEWWTHDGKSWVVEAAGVKRDGGKTRSVNVISPTGANSYTWQSVRRTLDGEELPDTAVVTLSRVSAKK